MEILIFLCFKVYNLLKFYSLQLKVVPYMSGIWLLLQHPQNSRRHLKYSDLLRKMAFKSEVTRFALYYILCFHPHEVRWHNAYVSYIYLLQQGYCFGFVAFETPGSVQSALEVLSLISLSLIIKIVLGVYIISRTFIEVQILVEPLECALFGTLCRFTPPPFLLFSFTDSDSLVFYFANCFRSFNIKRKKFFSVLPVETISRIYLMSSSGTICLIVH